MARVLEGRNRASASEAASFAEELDRLEQEREVKLADLDAEFKAKKLKVNKQYNGDQSAIYEDAKKVGVAKGNLRAIVAGQKGIRKTTDALENAKERARDKVEALESDERDFTVDIITALGRDFADFGLGAAAVERERLEDDDKDPDSDKPDPVAAAAAAAWNDDPDETAPSTAH